MFKHFFSHIDIVPSNINILNGNAPDLHAECTAYEAKIKAVGGIDLFLGGIGADGHIAFNEPGSSLASRTRVKTLAYETVIANSRFFGGNLDMVPKMALTVGVATIMEVCRAISTCAVSVLISVTGSRSHSHCDGGAEGVGASEVYRGRSEPHVHSFRVTDASAFHGCLRRGCYAGIAGQNSEGKSHASPSSPTKLSPGSISRASKRFQRNSALPRQFPLQSKWALRLRTSTLAEQDWTPRSENVRIRHIPSLRLSRTGSSLLPLCNRSQERSLQNCFPTTWRLEFRKFCGLLIHQGPKIYRLIGWNLA